MSNTFKKCLSTRNLQKSHIYPPCSNCVCSLKDSSMSWSEWESGSKFRVSLFPGCYPTAVSNEGLPYDCDWEKEKVSLAISRSYRNLEALLTSKNVLNFSFTSGLRIYIYLYKQRKIKKIDWSDSTRSWECSIQIHAERNMTYKFIICIYIYTILLWFTNVFWSHL